MKQITLWHCMLRTITVLKQMTLWHWLLPSIILVRSDTVWCVSKLCWICMYMYILLLLQQYWFNRHDKKRWKLTREICEIINRIIKWYIYFQWLYAAKYYSQSMYFWLIKQPCHMIKLYSRFWKRRVWRYQRGKNKWRPDTVS